MDPKGAYEEEVGEEPVDYSKKYMERDHRSSEAVAVVQESQVRSGTRKKEYSEPKKVDLFGDYAETDLDQPTDYSLRYAEDDTDEDEKQVAYFVGGVQEDTLKTYCTEGTPYETPLNFSTATSMSDLRLEDAKDGDTLKRPVKKPVHPSANPVRCKEEERVPQELEKSPDASKVAPVLDSDCVPLGEEKLACYYESSTPDAFPRVNSLSSLGSTNAQQNVSETSSKTSTEDVKPVVLAEISNNVVADSLSPEVSKTPSEPDVAPEKSARVIDKEGKMVTFGGEDFYAEQTPLMFSRSSSLGSLSGFEQFSIHDDRSSIVSDFSRRTSGIVSPSELPDSPTQTAPPSPGNRKNQCADFVSKIPEEASPNPRTSVFEDDIATFKEESTPIEFSTATSLSSLTIDDEVKIPEILEAPKSLDAAPQALITPDNVRESRKETTFAEKACQVEVGEVEKDQEQVSDADEGDDDDEDILAACISRGMQNNRYRQSFKPNDLPKPVQGVLGRCPRSTPVTKSLLPENSTATLKGKPQIEAAAAPDSVHVYCTEDTPADISPVGSQSNLSVLSMPSVREDAREDKEASEVESHRNDLSDESSNLSGEDEKMLDACIQSGMPKVRQITPPPVKSIACAPKLEGATQRFNICGTPSSSPVESGSKSTPMPKTACQAGSENDPEFSDDSLNHSDDEAILTECIRSAMPKARLNISPLTGLSSQNATKCKPPLLHPPKVNQVPAYFQPRYTEQSKKQQRPAIPFESNISLSEEDEDEDNILAQCIRSGIPRALNGSSIASASKKIEQTLKPRILEAPNNFFKNRTSSNRDVGTQVSSTTHQTHQRSTIPMDPESSNFSRFQVKPNDRNKYSRNSSRSIRQGMERMTLRDHPSQPSAPSRYPMTFNDHQEMLRLSSLNSGSVRSRGSPMTPADHQEIIRLASSNGASMRSRGSPMTPSEHQEILRLASSSTSFRSRPTNSASPMTPSDYQEMIRLASSNGASVRTRAPPMAPSDQEIIHRSLSNTTSVRIRHSNCGSPMPNGTEHYEDDDPARHHPGKSSSNIAPSRHSSVSSLSEEGSLGSIEEWALLELCINSALPRNRCRLKSAKVAETHEEREPINEDAYSICSYSSYVCKT